ncbi:MAG: hypothetical protein PHV16_01300 [Candidatus Nanoarchaeia archaeon]|nr:hypothetical protein [Candidatus Nanoarchaeia archaeon]
MISLKKRGVSITPESLIILLIAVVLLIVFFFLIWRSENVLPTP